MRGVKGAHCRGTQMLRHHGYKLEYQLNPWHPLRLGLLGGFEEAEGFFFGDFGEVAVGAFVVGVGDGFFLGVEGREAGEEVEKRLMRRREAGQRGGRI